MSFVRFSLLLIACLLLVCSTACGNISGDEELSDQDKAEENSSLGRIDDMTS